ncbi:MAG: chromosomal replication initiator protein DnaA [Candidatus Krumholzibacteria bacterium]|nr:chromosomal replication initiator protein DnaA [Candidatus Krumholzibacteria bacterium]
MSISPSAGAQDDEYNRIWSKFLTRVSTMVSKQTVETWFQPMRISVIEENKVSIDCPSKFSMDWVIEHHEDKIRYVLKDILECEPDLHFCNTKEAHDELFSRRATIQRPPIADKRTGNGSEQLNPKYTFDEFVAGSNSRMTYAACLAVAEKPAIVYNPLFIYGGVGLGKTHLMQAIGHHVLATHDRIKVHYSSAEMFMNELIWAIRQGKSHEFREKYRNVEILLIDDIQFLAGKESTQEEFFHTFNALHGANKQIVVTSDRPPKEIPTLEERLISRFEWGLVSDIQSPDYETRLAILRKKVERENVPIPDDILCFIADSIKSNIRELEGSLVKLVVHASVHRTQMTIETAQEILKHLIKHEPRKTNIALIQKVVSQHFRVPVDAMKSKVRTAAYVFPRQVAIYLARDITNCSLTQIGQRFGGRDHTTVIHACQKIANKTKDDVALKATIQQLKRELT